MICRYGNSLHHSRCSNLHCHHHHFFHCSHIPFRFIISISYFGLSLSTPNMNGDPYLNCFLSALVEILAYFAAWLLLKWVPRRAVLTVPMLTGGLVLCLIHFVPPGESVGYSELQWEHYICTRSQITLCSLWSRDSLLNLLHQPLANLHRN